jgi:SAM-dependent methyltransferase
MSDQGSSASTRVTLLRRLLDDPVGLVWRTLSKTIIGRIRYRRGHGYDAAEYWGDRFRRYGLSLRGPGHEGLSEEHNAVLYGEATTTLVAFCAANGIDLGSSSVLEIGCGTGIWAGVCRAQGNLDYTGVDITDILFSELRSQYPKYRFVKADVTADRVPGQFDVVLMIDVVEHIVEESALQRAMGNVRAALKPGGAFVIALPHASNETGPRNLFYLRFWPDSAIRQCFPGLWSTAAVPFRNGNLFALMAPVPSDEF